MRRENPFPYLRPVYFRPRPPAFTVVFLHIPKTAGMSLRELLLARTAPHPHFRVVHPRADHARLEVLHRDDRAALGLVEGHLYYGVHEILPRPCVYLTMLRDPVERVLSYYSFIREHGPHHLHERVQAMSIADCFAQELTVEMDNFMVRSLTSLRRINVPFGGVTREMLIEAKAHLDSIAGIGLTERFDESLRRFCGLLGWEPLEVPRLNETRGRLGRASLSEREVDAIARHNALDAELYTHARRLFEARGAAGA